MMRDARQMPTRPDIAILTDRIFSWKKTCQKRGSWKANSIDLD